MHGFAYIVWNIFTTNFGRHAVVHFNPLQSQQCSFSSGVHCLITVEGVLSEDVIWGLVHTWGLQFRFWLEKLGSSPNNLGYPFIAPKCSTACIPRVDTCIYSTRGACSTSMAPTGFRTCPGWPFEGLHFINAFHPEQKGEQVRCGYQDHYGSSCGVPGFWNGPLLCVTVWTPRPLYSFQALPNQIFYNAADYILALHEDRVHEVHGIDKINVYIYIYTLHYWQNMYINTHVQT